MNLHKMTAKVDDDVLAEIIAGLEGKMTEPGEGKPFKKKAALVIDAEPEESEMDLAEHEASETEGEEKGEESLEDLMELLNRLKG